MRRELHEVVSTVNLSNLNLLKKRGGGETLDTRRQENE